METLVWGYGLIEGPRPDDAGNLYFSDVRKGGVFRLGPDGAVETVVPKRRGVGGIALHAEGGLVISGRNICHVRDGQTRVLFESENVPGYNDLTVDGAGRVYFGTIRSDPFDWQGVRTPGECWRIDTDGRAAELYGGVGLSNGMGFSPDSGVLYHADTAEKCVWAHDVDAGGGVSGRRQLVRLPDLEPDGLAVDEAGTVWVADVSGSGAVRGFGPDGTEVGRVEVPAKMVTSCCFGGPDRRDLYVVTADNTDDPAKEGTVFRTRAEVPGVPVPLARV